MKKFKKHIGRVLNSLRNRDSLNIKDVKKYLEKCGKNFSIETIHNWEKGEIVPSIENLYLLSKFYNYPISAILDDDLMFVYKLSNLELFIINEYKYNSNFKKLADEIFKYYVAEYTAKNKANINF